MLIYVDADACPRPVKEILYRTVGRVKIEMFLVSNQNMNVPFSQYIKTIVVPGGMNIADDKIVELVQEGDLVITADIPLADRVVEKRAFALNPRGRLYTIDNIKQALSMRNFLSDLRDNGTETGGPAAFTNKDKQLFANALDRFLAKHKG